MKLLCWLGVHKVPRPVEGLTTLCYCEWCRVGVCVVDAAPKPDRTIYRLIPVWLLLWTERN